MIKLETIGADPEFVIVNDKQTPIGSFIFFEGTKSFPEEIEPGYFVHRDNLLVEGNIPACSTKEEFVLAMKKIKNLIKDRIKESGSDILCVDEIDYEDDFIYTDDGLDFGCSSYIDVYEDAMIPTPRLRGNARTVGAHIHVGYDFTEDNDIIEQDMNLAIGKALDFFIGIPSDQILKSKYRRRTYGKLGSIRNTAYGLEYRSLGGFFLQDEYLEWQYDQVKKAIEFCADPSNYDKLSAVHSADEKYYDFLGINIDEQIPVKKLELV